MTEAEKSSLNRPFRVADYIELPDRVVIEFESM